MSTKKPTKNKIYSDTNLIESWREIGKGLSDVAGATAQTLSTDVLAGFSDNLWDQLLGAKEEPKKKTQGDHGDLKPGEELDLSGKKQEKEKKHIEAGIDYASEIIHGEKRITAERGREMEGQIQQIVSELKRLTASSKVLQSEFKEVVMDQRITKPGKYHVSFFEWVLTVIRSARIRVEDSGAWLSTFKSKKKDKQYWGMFKKHGTSFGMSNERNVATQVG